MLSSVPYIRSTYVFVLLVFYFNLNVSGHNRFANCLGISRTYIVATIAITALPVACVLFMTCWFPVPSTPLNDPVMYLRRSVVITVLTLKRIGNVTFCLRWKCLHRFAVGKWDSYMASSIHEVRFTYPWPSKHLVALEFLSQLHTVHCIFLWHN